VKSKIKLVKSGTHILYMYKAAVLASMSRSFSYYWTVQYLGHKKGEITYQLYKGKYPFRNYYKYGRFTKNMPEDGKELLEKVKREVEQLCG